MSHRIISTNINKYCLLLFVLNLFVSFSCVSLIGLSSINTEYQNKQRNTIVYSNDSIKYYRVKMDTTLYNLKLLRLQIYKGTKFVKGQIMISYDYCKDYTECKNKVYEGIENGNRIVFHDELTGQIINSDSIWMHPPRSEYFTVLEMNAFPFFVKNRKEWTYNLNFGDHWGDKRWATWEGRRTSQSIYERKELVSYKFGNRNLDCIEISACTTVEDLGFTESTFYYNDELGFVYMFFRTINNKTIEFKLI